VRNEQVVGSPCWHGVDVRGNGKQLP
jgi:hypothetical protein